MKILIIGGTKFVGRHLVAGAQARNHEVTLFNRGKDYGENLPDVEQIHGDRNSDLDKLSGRKWDAVIDTCGYLPQTVSASARALADSIERYVFISSISAYQDFSQPNYDESAPLAVLSEEQQQKVAQIDAKGELTGQILGEEYGALKALCEQAAEKEMPEQVLTIRPGLIVGPYDWTDRFTYWVARVAQGGEILAPGRPTRFVQLIDARDLSEWIIRMVESKQTGIYNANGLPSELIMGRVLEASLTISNSDATFTWVSEDFLNEEKVGAWSEMPLWLPEETYPEGKGFMFANVAKAVRDGLTLRPLTETIKDTLDWYNANRSGEKLKAGIDFERERELLNKWHRRNK